MRPVLTLCAATAAVALLTGTAVTVQPHPLQFAPVQAPSEDCAAAAEILAGLQAELSVLPATAPVDVRAALAAEIELAAADRDEACAEPTVPPTTVPPTSGAPEPTAPVDPSDPAEPTLPPIVVVPVDPPLFADCDEARAAGAAPILIGQPGYRPALDSDGDGIACELTVDAGDDGAAGPADRLPVGGVATGDGSTAR